MIKKRLKELLKKQLPGKEAHIDMAPKTRNRPFRNFEPAENPRNSAVMIILSEDNDGDLQVILTLRSAHLSNHSRQISFPGGRADLGETPEETALRETHEEIGLEPEKIDVLGSLSDLFVPPSRSLIQPIVGWTEVKNNFVINPDEVEEIFFVKIKDMIHNDSVKFQKRIFNKKEVDIPFWDVHHEVPLWGATAMIMSELLDIIRSTDIFN